MSYLPFIFQTLESSQWTWSEVSTGSILGHKAGHAFSKWYVEESLYKIMEHLLDGYKLYAHAHSLGIFEKYPQMIAPIQYGAILVTTLNLQTVFFRHAVPENRVTAFAIVSADVWNLTPKALGVASVAAMLFNFSKQPIQSVACLTTMTVTWLSEFKLLTPALISITKVIPWLARGNKFWEADAGRGWIVIDARLLYLNYSHEVS